MPDCLVAKAKVAGSNPVFRSNKAPIEHDFVLVGAVVFVRLVRRQSVVSRRFVAPDIALHRRASGCIGLQTHVRFGRMSVEKRRRPSVGDALLASLSAPRRSPSAQTPRRPSHDDLVERSSGPRRRLSGAILCHDAEHGRTRFGDRGGSLDVLGDYRIARD
jgi:hypothetical protein